MDMKIQLIIALMGIILGVATIIKSISGLIKVKEIEKQLKNK